MTGEVAPMIDCACCDQPVRPDLHTVADGRALYLIQAALGMIDPFEDPVFKFGLWRCEKCDLTKTRRNQKKRQKARENNG